MNRIFKILFTCIPFMWISPDLFCQYFTVKGKQLLDESGNPFYPVALPLQIHLIHRCPADPVVPFPYSIPYPEPDDDDLDDYYYIAPTYHDGGNDYYECTDEASCFQALVDELYKMKDMGFNTLRLTGFIPSWNRHGPAHPLLPDGYFYIMSQKNCIPYFWVDNDYLKITQPYSTNHVLNFLIDKLDPLITVATSAPLNFKLLIETGNGGSKIPVPQYEELLQFWIDYFKTKTSVIAYVLASEPAGSEDYYQTKWWVCDKTAQWYDFIKNDQQDPHLISTTGGIEDVIYWDPAVIKSDLFEIHPYPNLAQWEKTIMGSPYTKEIAIDRIKGIFYWLSNYCSKPWYIGETGFMAVQLPLFPDELDGTINEQADYAEDTYLAALNCGASGYGWWNYQDEFIFYNNATVEQGRGFGLLKHGDIPSSPQDLYDKPAVDIFQNFAANPPTPSACTLPDYYPDPYNCGAFNPSHTNAVTGTIVDDNNNPIKGGFAHAVNWRYYDGTLFNPYVNTWYYYYANDNGNFEAIPFNDKIIGQDRIVGIRGSAPAASKFETPPWTPPYGWTDIQITPAQLPQSLTTLQKINFDYDGTFEGENIDVGTQKDLKGWNTVTVSNTIIDGTSDITARQEININAAFHATNTSEVHIFPSEAFIDCNVISTFARMAQTNSGNEIQPGKEIEIDFNFSKSGRPAVQIAPNPNSGMFTLEILNSENQTAVISVKNPIGDELSRMVTNEQKISLDLRNLSKGIYFVETNINNYRILKKLIIQ